jgi:purine-cytosine permease-like protein
MSVTVGVSICSLISLVLVILGIDVFQAYERYALATQLPALFVLISLARTHFGTSAPSLGASAEKSADCMSFFLLCVSGALVWASAAADFHAYYPLDMDRLKVLLSINADLGFSCITMNLIGAGIDTGVGSNPTWSFIYESGAGALMDYWTLILTLLTLEEDFIFKRRGLGYNWSWWNKEELLSVGITAFIIVIVG